MLQQNTMIIDEFRYFCQACNRKDNYFRIVAPPPNGIQTNFYFFKGGFAVKVML